jgi:hypothetical protein
MFMCFGEEIVWVTTAWYSGKEQRGTDIWNGVLN